MRYLFMLLVVAGALFGAGFGKVTAMPIIEIDEERSEALIYANNLHVGESGLIVRWFDNNHASIVASMAVVAIEGDKARIAFRVFDALQQEAFPIPQLRPKINDEVLIRGFYDRALLIAPNQELYQKVESSYDEISWVHPDLFGAFLISEGRNAPSKSDFRKFCDFYSVGLIYMVNMNKGQVLDCQTFTVLQEDYITGRVKSEDTIKPFYSRIGTMESGWLDFVTNDVRDYYAYYDMLLKGKDTASDVGLFGAIIEYFNQD